jgi:hypothetical protein
MASKGGNPPKGPGQAPSNAATLPSSSAAISAIYQTFPEL